MILIASMADPDTYRKTGGGWDTKIRFEDLTGRPALIRHYSQVNPEFVARYPIQAMFITGFGYGWAQVPPEATYGINDVLHQVDIPVLAACGGHQLVGFLFNNDVRQMTAFQDEFMRVLGPDEPDYYHTYHPGHFTETGVHPVYIVRDDPIFEGLPNPFKVVEAHSCEVKTLPPGFVHLARNDNCELQCFRHADRPLYGTQFHAEAWTDHYQDGKRFVENWLRIAGLM